MQRRREAVGPGAAATDGRESPPPSAVDRGALLVAATFVLYSVWFYRDLLFQQRVYVFRDAYTLLLATDHLARVLSHWHWPPLWNPLQVLGKPFAADPLTAVYYPPNWLFRAMPEPLGFNAAIAAHHAWAAIGAFALLRRWRLSTLAAAFGGFVFGFGGPLVSLDNMVNALQSSVWAPWTILAFDVWQEQRGLPALLATGLTIGAMLLAGMPEYVLFTNALLLALAYDYHRGGRGPGLPASLAALIGANLLAAGLCAVQLVPFAEYLARSSRASGLGVAGIVRYSLHPLGLLAFLVPRHFVDAGGAFHETAALWEGKLANAPFLPTLYLGPALVLLLAAAPFLSRFQRRWWGSLTVLLLALALGKYLPGYVWVIEHVPPLRAVRYPEKFLLLAHLLLSAGVAAGLESAWRQPQRFRTVAVAAVALASAAVGADALLPARSFAVSLLRQDLLLLALLLALLSSLALLGSRSQVSARRVAIALILLTALDLYRVNGRLLPTISWAEALRPPPTLDVMKRGDDPLRIYSSGLGRPALPAFPDSFLEEKNLLLMADANFYLVANLNAPGAINLADHERLEELIESAPRPRTASLLAAFNTAYVTSPKELHYPGLTLVQRPRNVLQPYVYRVDNLAPRAFVPPQLQPVASDAEAIDYLRTGGDPSRRVIVDAASMPADLPPEMAGRVHIDQYGAQEIRLQADMETAGLVVLSDTYYPGWTASVDGVRSAIVRADYFGRGVYVTAGERRIVFRFQPPSQRIGAAISLVLAGVMLFLLLRRAWRGGNDASPRQ